MLTLVSYLKFKDMEIEIHLPSGALGASSADTMLDTLMRLASEKYSKDKDADWAEKYGTDFENDKLMIHQFCWCEKDSCKWCGGEYPNFWYKPLDFKVRWYKYIGRGMEYNKTLSEIELKQMAADLGLA